MHIAALALAWLLLGQVSGGSPPGGPDQQPIPPPSLWPAAQPAEPAPRSLLKQTASDASAKTASPDGPSPAEPAAADRPHRPTPPEIVARSLTLPRGSKLTGQPMLLVTVLSATQDRRQQIESTHAYWRLAEAVAGYGFCVEENKQLGQLPSGGDEALELRLARASAAAAEQEAEARALAAQHEMAGLMSLSGDSPPPLPADWPHVGSYHTFFKEMFGAGPGMDRTRLIDRTLPLRAAAIDAHALALQASEDALAAALEAQAGGQRPVSLLVKALAERRRQQVDFMASVCRYNHDIADYALTVAPVLSGSEALAAMLIRSRREATAAPAETSPGGVVPASASETVVPPAPPLSKEPTRAVRPPQRTDEDPHLQPPTTPWTPSAPEGKQEPTPVMHSLLRHDDTATPDPPAPTTRQSQMPITDGQSAEPASPAVYSALVHASGADRTRQLTLTLCWDRCLPAGSGRPTGLAECLRPVPAANRFGVIEAYWLAGQRAAQYQALVEEGQWLDALVPAVLDEGVAAAMLQLREARLACRAAQIEAQVALAEAQFALAWQTGHAADVLWPLPNSLPRADLGPANFNVPSDRLAESWALRRWKSTLPLLARSLQDRAAAVVQADTARAAATLGYPAGRRSLAEVLAAVGRQTAETFALLQTLTDYNGALAGYTLSILPSDSPAETLAAALLPPQR